MGVDRLTKYGHFIPLSHPYIAETLVELFLKHIHILDGIQEVIVSDRDMVFQNLLWKEFFKLLGTKLNMSTAHHSKSD